MPIERNPGKVSRAISLPIIKARYAAHGTRELESQAINLAIEFFKSLQALPNHSIHLLSARECRPPKPCAPKRLWKAVFLPILSACLRWVAEGIGVFPSKPPILVY